MANLKDYGNKFDKGNNRDYRNANYHELTYISDETYNYYVRYPLFCPYCPVDSSLGKCLCSDPENCKFSHHPCYSYTTKDGKRVTTKKKPVIETKTDPKKSFTIFITRATLIWLYHNKIPFIFRTGKVYVEDVNGKEVNIVQHHKDGNPFNDSIENIIMLFSTTHTTHHSIERRLLHIIRNFEALIKENPKNNDFKYALEGMIKWRESVMNDIVTEEGVWTIIENECKLLGVEFKR